MTNARLIAGSTRCSAGMSTSMCRSATRSAAGWQRRIEDVRRTVGRQQDDRIRVLEHLLNDVWGLLEGRCSAGMDRAVDGARAAYREAVPRQRR